MSMLLLMGSNDFYKIYDPIEGFKNTRSYVAADLDWIIGPGYSLGGYILEKNHEQPTWNHEKP